MQRVENSPHSGTVVQVPQLLRGPRLLPKLNKFKCDLTPTVYATPDFQRIPTECSDSIAELARLNNIVEAMRSIPLHRLGNTNTEYAPSSRRPATDARVFSRGVLLIYNHIVLTLSRSVAKRAPSDHAVHFLPASRLPMSSTSALAEPTTRSSSSHRSLAVPRPLNAGEACADQRDRIAVMQSVIRHDCRRSLCHCETLCSTAGPVWKQFDAER